MELFHSTNKVECLRLKIIERLLKEGSSADEPINIPLSDYSSDEGSSSSSENEGKGSIKDFSDLEGPCCHPLRAPPCSPELDVEIRKFRYSRMRKVLQELDRLYFQPLFHKKCNLMKSKRLNLKNRKRKNKKSRKSKYNKTETARNRKLELVEHFQTSRNTKNITNSRKINLHYVANSETQKTILENSLNSDKAQLKLVKKRYKGGDIMETKPRLKVSRKFRLWLEKSQIIIKRNKMPHRLKFRFKSLHRRKKDERLLLDMPTTDPGSDLLFSTDDEYIDANGVVTCYSTMPRIRRNLLKSELQRRYIEEIGDGIRNMPPELIITSPSNRAKQKNHSVRILYKPAAAERYERKTTINELPYIGEPAKRTSSWHNLNMNTQSPILTPNKPIIAKTKIQSPFHRPVAKKETLSKEDLDIKLSLKKKIWTGIQPDDNSLGIDRSRQLSWLTPHSLKATTRSRKTTSIIVDQYISANNLTSPSSSNIKRLENEAFLTACTQKLMEWQILNSNTNSPRSQKPKLPLKLVVPEINEDQTMRIFKQLANIKKPCTPNITKLENENKTRPKRNTITKIAETSQIFSKITKCKTRNNLAVSHRSMTKQSGNQHKSHGRGSKFKTGGIVVTAVQPIGGNTKKNKKTKSQHNKLPDTNCSNTTKNNVGASGAVGDARRPSTNTCNGGGMIMAATATTLVRKVKTKLKKKKSPTNNTQNIS